MQPDRFLHYIGVDWATEAHRVCLLDQHGTLLGRISIPHSGDGLQQLLTWLSAHGVTPARAAVAIEVPRGAVVETLTERGFTVYSINPKQVDRFRDRFSVAGAKDDDRDALVQASCLRTDLHLFRPVPTETAECIRLRELFRTADELRVEMQRYLCRLCEQLRRYYPAMLALCPNAQQPFLWELIEAAPLPADAARLTLDQVQAILKKHHMRRLTAEQVIATLTQPALHVAPGAAEAAAEHIRTLLPRLRLTRELREGTLKQLRAVLQRMRQAHTGDRPSDVEIVMSMPGVGELTAAALFSEAGRAIAERDEPALRTQSGMAPVSRNSGKSSQVVMRRACNERLRNALHFSTLSSLRFEPINRRHYDELRAANHTCARSVRGVADRNLSVLVAMLKHGTLYDPRKRKGYRAEDAQAARVQTASGEAENE
jgi:transposase